MQWTALVRPEYWDKIPAVVHYDGTARLQTVTPEQNADLYHLLKLFRERTGIGVLLNTSFNGKDEPIVESAADALRCLETTALDAVVFPPFIISKSALD
jgi:carbamoyltransferase